jgi:ABC-type transport system involved in cytochrome c biogenesis permease subunit
MKVLWTLVKVVFVLAVAIPISIIMLAAALGILGALVGIAILSLKVAVLALVGWGMFRLISRMLGGPAKSSTRPVSELPPVDPHYEAAMRELDRELGGTSR